VFYCDCFLVSNPTVSHSTTTHLTTYPTTPRHAPSHTHTHTHILSLFSLPAIMISTHLQSVNMDIFLPYNITPHVSKQLTWPHCISINHSSSAKLHSICCYFNSVPGVWQQVIQYNRCAVCSGFSLGHIIWLACISAGNVIIMLKGTNMSVKFREMTKKKGMIYTLI